ncbi:ATP-binding protein [Streptomyces halstedii]|uniref:ATP-binding protein n=1 Tax=Streptomyces halstedii TaxID=1944 RepID=UPI00325118C7
MFPWIVTLVALAVSVWYGVRAYQAGRDAYAASARAELADRQARAAEARTLALTEEIRQLARKRIPAAATALSHPSAPVPGLREAGDIEGDAARLLSDAVQAARTAILEERGRVDAAARSAMRGTSAQIQSLLNQSQHLLHELQHEYDDPRILQLDFRNELALRRTQATAVLCDAWPGLARQNSPLVEIVLGAQSRVGGYERIRVANHLRQERLALVARAAEPLAIALAELMANATAYSHPDTEVPVTVQQTAGRGALVLVDDAGIGMDDDALKRARALLSGPSEVLLTELGDPPQTGFAVVGRLVARYGFTCHIEPSPYGGMRAMLRVPAHLLTVMDDDRTLSVLAPSPVHARPPGRDGGTAGGEARGDGAVRSDDGHTPAGGDGDGDRGSDVRRAGSDARHAGGATGTDEAGDTAGTAGPGGTTAPAAAAPATTAPTAATGSAAAPALPSRRRRARLTAPPEAAGPARTGEEAEEAVLRTPERAGASWTALQQGTLDGRSATTPPASSTDDQGDDET